MVAYVVFVQISDFQMFWLDHKEMHMFLEIVVTDYIFLVVKLPFIF